MEATGVNALVTTVLVLGGCYALACLFWPHAACGRCEGDGKIRSPGGKAWRRCPRCKGSGWRQRWGAALWSRNRGRR